MSREQSERLLNEGYREQSQTYFNNGDLWRDLQLIFGLMLTYDKRLEKYLRKCDQARAQSCIEFIKNAPGNKSQQLVFCYYMTKGGLVSAFVVALFYPLVPSLCFLGAAYLFHSVEWSENIYLLYCFQIAMIGIRCSVVTYLIRYCLHFPSETYYWINYLGSILIGIILTLSPTTRDSPYGYIAVYFCSIMLAYYRKTQNRDSSTVRREREEENAIKEQYKPLQNLPRIDGKLAIILLVVMLSFFWILGKYANEEQYGPLKELFVVGMLNLNQESIIFYFSLAFQLDVVPPSQKYYIPNLYGFGILFPGLHLKAFFILLQGFNVKMLVFSYLALHLPSLLLMCIYISYSSMFQSVTWKCISNSIQFVSNGLVLVTVGRMLQQETCHRHIIIFTSLLIFTITKQYKLYEFISALLGVFLVTSRTLVLHLSGKTPIDQFLCLNQQ